MTAFRPSALVACGLLVGSLPGSLAATAQERSTTQERSTMQERAAAGAGRNTAAKLAGLAGFVNLDCPGLRSDPGRLRQAVEAMGVDAASLETGELLLAASAYLEAYRRDVPASCRGAEERFGPSGTLIPGVIVPR